MVPFAADSRSPCRHYGCRRPFANKPASRNRGAHLIGRLKATRQLAFIGVVVSLLAAAGAARADDAKPAPTPEQRMQARFPQKVRVGDLIGLPLLDEAHSTLGLVREVVRDKDGKVELVIGYGGIFSYLGWDTRPVAVPIEVVGIRGRELASLDMPRREYAAAPMWRQDDTAVLPPDATIRVALCRGY